MQKQHQIQIQIQIQIANTSQIPRKARLRILKVVSGDCICIFFIFICIRIFICMERRQIAHKARGGES